MSDLYNSICLTTVKNTVLDMLGVECSERGDCVNPVLKRLRQNKLGEKRCDRAVLYNPDAVALWLYQKYTENFFSAMLCSDVAVPMLSVMPSVTPVCFASMYTGVQPQEHGIMKYEKPVLTSETLFDCLIKADRRVAIVSTARDSISMIFLEREMDYFIYETVDEINKKAIKLIDEDKYDVIVIYNGNYDAVMHRNGPESEKAMSTLQENIEFYGELVCQIHKKWQNHNVFYGFMPDHGCHEIDGGLGSHGLEMQEDMNIIHFYGIKTSL